MECRKKRLAVQLWPAERAIATLASAPSTQASSFGFDLSRVRLRAGSSLLQAAPASDAAPTEFATPEPGSPEIAPEPAVPPSQAPELTPEPPATPEPAAPEAATTLEGAASASASFLVDDTATELAPGQMRKSDFLDQLRPAVCAEADAALAATGRSSAGCPYLDFWFDYYARQDAAHSERALQRYAPEATNVTSASDYIPIVAGRVRQGVERWAVTGEITGVPEGIPLGITGEASPAATPVQAKPKPGGVRTPQHPEAIQSQLGQGQPLEGGLRSKMESAFGNSFGQVRVHNDAAAGALSRQFNARAFTVGNHVAFAPGEYQPHSLIGQVLVAHELAHVMQQANAPADAPATMSMGDGTYHALESDADQVAVGAVASLFGGARSVLSGIVRNAIPSLRSGLRLQRCKSDSTSASSSSSSSAPASTPSSGSPAASVKTGTFAVNMTPFVTGVEGTVKFTPDPKNCPVCKLIRLVQIVRVFEKPGTDYAFPGGEAPREKVKTKEDVAKGIKPNFFVDHFAAKCTAGAGCSLYYRDHASVPTKSQDGSNDGKVAKEASLWDRPSGDADDIFEFETCARCDDTGNYLRCVDWGFTADSAGKVTNSPANEHASPSATFLAAVKTFDKYYGNK